MSQKETFALLETILYEPFKGFYLLDQHIHRLLKAAIDFHTNDTSQFKIIPSFDQIKNFVEEKVPQDTNTFKRVRLLYNDSNEGLKVEYTDLGSDYKSNETLTEALLSKETLLTVILDTEAIPCSVTDPFILHKTTQRQIYNDARKRTQCGEKTFDVILWNKHHQITESSIANIAIQTDKGKWITPSLQCGLLPGVFRDKLLSSDENIIEGVITMDDLINAQKNGDPIVCFNSVRKIYRVQLLL
ncbi:hypothetical protein INT45_001480 [Circinella minor]|uniref:Uncharacterized protein n=1 Tax=Circinella minor TaxID=1195481 RepID=A0A8H7SBN1_9FUNG|nr:hypothetical protein INT45_001480 [Circinella minor]